MIRTPGQIERTSMELIRAELRERKITLSPENEAVILRSLKQESDGRTVLLVSHRASTVRIADERVFIENGRVS